MFAGAAFTDSADIKVKSEVVDTLTALGVVAGFEDGSFQPNGTVTRAQMAKMIYVLRTGKSDASAYNDDKTSFTDINGHWARGYIKYCQSLGIIAGKSNTKFDPNGNVTAQEAAKMLLVTLGYDASKVGLTGANWASKTNALADENGLLKDVNTSFTAACPRQYAAQLIYNTIFANTVILRDGEYTNMNALGTGKNATVGVKYMDLVEFDAGTLYTCKLVDGKDYYSITTKKTPQGGHGKVYTDASDLLGQNVTVLMKSTSKETTVYGIYADEDSKVLATGYVGALEKDGDKKVKLNGTSYKVEQTVGGTENNKAAIVTYAQSNENVELVSGTDASLVDLAAKVDKSASIDAHIAASTIKLIDNDGNGKVDAAVYTPAKVGKVNTVSKSAIAVHQRHVLGRQTAVNGAAVAGVAALAEHEHGLGMIPQTDGTFFGSIAGISAKIARGFNRKRGFDGVHVILQVDVRRGARVGFGLGGVLNRGQAVAYVLCQLVAVHAAARQLAHGRVAHLFLYVFDRVLNGLCRHARTRGVAQLSRR